MLKIIRKLKKLPNNHQKKSMVLLVFVMLIGAALEALSIGALVPVVTIVMDPVAVETNRYISFIYQTLGFNNTVAFTVFMMVTLIVFFVLKNLFLFFQTKWQM